MVKSALRSQLQPVQCFSRYHPGQHLYCSSRHLPSRVLHRDNPQWEASTVPPGAAELIGLIEHRAFSQPRDWAKYHGECIPEKLLHSLWALQLTCCLPQMRAVAEGNQTLLCFTNSGTHLWQSFSWLSLKKLCSFLICIKTLKIC